MATLDEKQKIARDRMKKAFNLAKEGQYEKARYLLQGMEHPKAKQLLQMLDGKVEVKKKKSTLSPFAIFMTIFVVVAVGGGIIGALWFQNYLGQFTLSELAGVDSIDFGGEWSEEDELLFDLLSYCFDYTGFEGDCSRWAERAVNRHYEAAQACFAPYAEEVFLSNAENDAIGECLSEAGIPEAS